MGELHSGYFFMGCFREIILMTLGTWPPGRCDISCGHFWSLENGVNCRIYLETNLCIVGTKVSNTSLIQSIRHIRFQGSSSKIQVRPFC